MAIETVTVDSGTGLDVAVDSGTEGAVQLVKLALSADGSTSLIAADAGGLLVNLGANNDVTGPVTDAELRATPVPVSGTVTSNAGTNLNTSLLALEAGGNLAAAATSLAALDNAVAGNEFQVDVLTLPALVAGTANIGDVDVLTIAAGDNNIGNVDIVTLPALVAGSANIGDVDVLTVPADPFGANADAASATGSISAKLRGIPTALGITALDLGSGTGGSRTLRSFQDTAQWVGGTGTDSSAVQRVSLATNVGLPAGTSNIGDVDVLTVPADPFGANADAASATGSISAKLRFIAGTGIPITGTVTVGTHAVTNAAGSFVVQENGSALTALQLIDDTVFTDDAAFTPGTSKVNAIGLQADEASTDSIDEGDIGAPRMTLDRKQIVVPQGHSAGGLSIFRSIDLDEGTLEIVKNAAGCLYSVWICNTATTTRFVKFYDAASGTYGTGTPVITIPIPGNSSDDITGHFTAGGVGIGFATGICVGAGTGVADNDTGAPGTNDVIINCFYK